MPQPRVHATSYGRPAAELLHARVAAAKAGDPLHPVTVLVPTNSVGVAGRRLLATGALGAVTPRGVGVAGLTLVTVYRLAELLGAPTLAAQGRRPVSTPLIGAVVREVLAADPGVFAPVVDHPSTEQALVRAHRELSQLRPSTLATLERQGRRARDVVRVHRAVRRRLADDWYEEADLMAAAGAAVRAGSAMLPDLGTVVVHLPQDLSVPAADLLRTVADATAMEVIAAFTGVEQADADVVRSLRRLGVACPDGPPAAACAVDEVVSVSDAEEEVRSAVERVMAAARDGVPLERMAVLYPHREPYARIVHEQFAAAGIASNGEAVRPLADRMVARWLLDLLDLPARQVDRPSVMGLLTSAPVVDRGGRRVPAGAWERLTRRAGIVRGRGDWSAKLRRYADEQRGAADAATDDDPDWLAGHARAQADLADRLRRFVGGLFAALDEAAGLASWEALAGWCRRAIGRWLDGDTSAWPDVEVDAADRVDVLLERLAGLDAVETHTDLPTFRRTLRLALDDDLGRTGTIGHGVLVGTPSAALGVDLDTVVLLGLAEGVAPTRPREDSLLPDAERRAVADELPPRDQHAGVEQRHLLAAMACAQRRIMIHPRGDLRRSVERAPSRWLLDAVAARADADADRVSWDLPPAAEWLEMVPSFAARVREPRFPATRQEYGLRALAGSAAGRLPAHAFVATDAVLRRGTAVIHERATGRFGRWSGRLGPHAAGLVAKSLAGRVTSATALEQWLRCPHAFLMRHVLRVSPIENPEELLVISPLERGSLVHDVLERWLCELLEGELPSPTEPWPSAVRERLRAIARQACDDAQTRGVTGHPLLWRRDRRRLLAELDDFVTADDDRRRASQLTPAGSELPFGVPGAADPVVIELDDGRVVRLRGRIDRVDRAADGTVVVADYKTGGTNDYRALSQDAPLADGTLLQLPVYGLAARAAGDPPPAVHTEYWFVSSRGQWQRIGYLLTDDVVTTLRDTLRVVADGLESGLFPMRPPEPRWRPWIACEYCEPDGLGTAERYREWERIRQDTALRAYLAVVEPDAVADETHDAAVDATDDAGAAAGARS